MFVPLGTIPRSRAAYERIGQPYPADVDRDRSSTCASTGAGRYPAVHRSEEVAVIPTMILFGLLLGRWWKTALVRGHGILDRPPVDPGARRLAPPRSPAPLRSAWPTPPSA